MNPQLERIPGFDVVDIYKGSDRGPISFIYKNPDGTAFDFSTSTVDVLVEDASSGALLFTLNAGNGGIVISNPVGGVVTITYLGSLTTGLTQTNGVQKIRCASQNGTPKVICTGNLTFRT